MSLVSPGPVCAVDLNLAVSATELATSVVTLKSEARHGVVDIVSLPLRLNGGPGRDVNPCCRHKSLPNFVLGRFHLSSFGFLQFPCPVARCRESWVWPSLLAAFSKAERVRGLVLTLTGPLFVCIHTVFTCWHIVLC